MDYFTALRLKFMRFWKKNKKKIFIIFIIWLIVIIINYILKNMPEKIEPPSISYTPHVTVLTEEEVPEKYQEPIENLVDTYFNYCNNKEYENAYNLITDECKKNVYPTLEQFIGYIDHVFEGKNKIYNIQSYSITDNKYVYNLRILDDILANGTTDGYYYYEEKIILIEENGEMKLSIGEFIEQVEPNITVEDDYLEIKIVNKVVDYETETYTVEFRNKTDKYIVIADNSQNNEVVLNLGGETRKPQNLNYGNVIIFPNSSKTATFIFNEYYDNGKTAESLMFGAIRVLNEYDALEGTTQENLDNAVKLYGLNLQF